MRVKELALNRMETDDILTHGIYGVLSINGGDGEYAYGVPLNYVYTGDRILLHCAVEGEKLDRIRKNNKVSFCVVREANLAPDKFSMEYSSAIVFGTAQIVDDEEKVKILLALVEKYFGDSKGQAEEAVAAAQHLIVGIRIDIESITGKAKK